MELAIPSSNSRLEETSERTASGPLNIGRRILRSLLITPRRIGSGDSEESTWTSSTRLIVLRRALRLSFKIRMRKRLETVLRPEAAPFGAIANTTGRMQKPHVRQGQKPFNSHPVSKSCAIQAHQDVRYVWSIHRGFRFSNDQPRVLFSLGCTLSVSVVECNAGIQEG